MDTKSLLANKYDTDKCNHPHYLRSYEEYLRPLQDREIKLLELGIYKGGSLQLWRDYFHKGTIVGLDLNPVLIDDPSGRIHIYQGEQQDTALLDRIARETAPEGFDVIIDDCSHIGELTRLSFWHLFDNHLKPGGLFLFDCWYGPAVLSDRPAVRVKRLEDDNIQVTRLAEPVLHANQNLVDVNYHVFIRDKQSGTVGELRETHTMRYLFAPEVQLFCERVGLKLQETRRFMEEGEPGFDSWNVVFLGTRD